jgi:hypothetical protein
MSGIYYLGLEAKQRRNDYVNLDEAKSDALIAAKRIGIPIRVFYLDRHNESHLIDVITPRDRSQPPPRIVDQLRLIK